MMLYDRLSGSNILTRPDDDDDDGDHDDGGDRVTAVPIFGPFVPRPSIIPVSYTHLTLPTKRIV